MANRDPTFGERLMYLFSPERANEKYRQRISAQSAPDGKKPGASPRKSYGNHGASRTLNR